MGNKISIREDILQNFSDLKADFALFSPYATPFRDQYNQANEFLDSSHNSFLTPLELNKSHYYLSEFRRVFNSIATYSDSNVKLSSACQRIIVLIVRQLRLLLQYESEEKEVLVSEMGNDIKKLREENEKLQMLLLAERAQRLYDPQSSCELATPSAPELE